MQWIAKIPDHLIQIDTNYFHLWKVLGRHKLSQQDEQCQKLDRTIPMTLMTPKSADTFKSRGFCISYPCDADLHYPGAVTTKSPFESNHWRWLRHRSVRCCGEIVRRFVWRSLERSYVLFWTYYVKLDNSISQKELGRVRVFFIYRVHFLVIRTQ